MKSLFVQTNHWFKNAIVYQVFIDRFNGFKTTHNTNNFSGGNLKGVIQKLDYLQNLGINTIWLSPFYETTAYHGYHITDFKKVDPRFGDEAILKNLIKAVKKREMHIIVDFVPNHCSVNHPFFIDAQNSKKSRYFNWFKFRNWPDNYLCFLDFKELPKLNLNNPETSDYMLNVAKYWLDMGIDGFRIDHAIGPSHTFWKKFNRKVVQNYPNAVFIGEVWAEGLKPHHFRTLGIKLKTSRRIVGINQDHLQLEYFGELNGALDFSLNALLRKHASKGKSLLKNRALAKHIKHHFDHIPVNYFMVAFLDNHDMDRFLRDCKGNIDLLLEAFEILFQLDQPLVIYNGTECCTYNKQAISASVPYSDLQVREPLDWKNLNTQFISGFKALVDKYRSI